MNRFVYQALTVAACLSLRSTTADSSFFDLSTTSGGQRFMPNQSVTFRCTVLISRTGTSGGVQWFRRQDSVSLLIATEIMPNSDFIASGRYSFNRGSATKTTADYTLTINDLVPEDSSTIECGHPRFTQRASVAFVVCTLPNKEICDCMVAAGWPSPACFDGSIAAQKSHDLYRNAAIGLGIALAVMIILSTLLTVCVIKDCLHQMRTKKEAKVAEMAAQPPPISLAPPGASVLKQPAPNGVISSGNGPGPSVRFSDDGRTPVVDRRTLPVDDGQGQRGYPKSGLYPSLEIEPSSFSQSGYKTSIDYTSAGYNQAHGAQNPQVPPYTNVPFNAALRSEAFHASGSVFVDSGSTEI